MIGLYAQNSNTMKQLVNLLDSLGVEAYSADHQYTSLIWLSQTPPPANNTVLPVETLPLTLLQWQQLIQIHTVKPVCYQNDSFLFEAAYRLLTNLKTKQKISLTEKETSLLSFLANASEHKATKETILQHVWQYNPDVETHTLESHLYGLRQKIGPMADNLICIQDGYLCLI